MADSKLQERSSGTERGISRRTEYPRDIFSLSPFTMMRRLSEEMDRAFAGTFGLSRDYGRAGIWSPVVEVREQNGNLEIDAELPGMKKEDVKVECTDEGIVIEGERKQEHEETEGGFRRSERSYGHFYRMIPLPQGAKPEQAKAEFKDGVLQVRVPIPESKPQRRQIQIETK